MMAVKGVRKPTFKTCGTRLYRRRGGKRYAALQGGGATTVSAALQAMPGVGVSVDTSQEAFDSKTVLDDFSTGGLSMRLP